MLLNRQWTTRFIQACEKVSTARRHSLAIGEALNPALEKGKCCIVVAGYIKIVEPRGGGRFIQLILGRGSMFGDRPFGVKAFRGFYSPQDEQAIAHSPATVLRIDREHLEAAATSDPQLAILILEAVSARTRFLERRLLWQFITPVRARMAATLRDLICFEGDRCEHGHTIDVRLTHEDLSEIIGAARPVISAELVRLKNEGLISYAKSYFCVDDISGLDRVASGTKH